MASQLRFQSEYDNFAYVPPQRWHVCDCSLMPLLRAHTDVSALLRRSDWRTVGAARAQTHYFSVSEFQTYGLSFFSQVPAHVFDYEHRSPGNLTA